MTALALLAVLAQVDGGTPDTIFVDAAQLLEGDAGVPRAELERLDPSTRQGSAAFGVLGGRWVELGPGCWLPAAQCMTKGAKIEQLLAENAELRRKPPGLQPIVVAAWVGFALGIVSSVVGIGVACQLVTGNVLCR